MEIYSVSDSLIDTTSAFASEVFIDYYNPLIGNEQAVYMADLFLSADAIKRLIDQGVVFCDVDVESFRKAAAEAVKEMDGVLFTKGLYDQIRAMAK